MAQKIIVEEGQKDPFKYCMELEEGNILFFPSIPFAFPQEDIDFLLGQRQGGSKARKNIAYKPQLDKITNHDTKDVASAEKLKTILKGFSKRATNYLSEILPSYANKWKLDYASFRPFQEKGRKLRVRARNDLLHVDAFPTRPLHGARILRFFTNINPTESRDWITSQPFESLLTQFGGVQGIPFPRSMSYSLKNRFKRKLTDFLNASGIKIPQRSPYDHFMLRMHHFLKENKSFQQDCPKDHWAFPPGSCWAVFTDQVSHAAMAGQYALEQTFFVPPQALLCPEKSPSAVLERLSGRNMVDVERLSALFT